MLENYAERLKQNIVRGFDVKDKTTVTFSEMLAAVIQYRVAQGHSYCLTVRCDDKSTLYFLFIDLLKLNQSKIFTPFVNLKEINNQFYNVYIFALVLATLVNSFGLSLLETKQFLREDTKYAKILTINKVNVNVTLCSSACNYSIEVSNVDVG